MPPIKSKTLYTARSQFWLGEKFFKPVERGGRPIEEGDPLLRSHAARFEPYEPRVNEYPGRAPAAGEKRGA